jgi:hypothetical protein
MSKSCCGSIRFARSWFGGSVERLGTVLRASPGPAVILDVIASHHAKPRSRTDRPSDKSSPIQRLRAVVSNLQCDRWDADGSIDAKHTGEIRENDGSDLDR